MVQQKIFDEEDHVIEIKIKKRLHFTTGKKDLSIDLKIPKGSFSSFFGKSGAGKTTLLRILAGLTAPDSGFLKVGDKYWFQSSKKINIPPQKRGIGYVFQDFALFPNMTVKENLFFAVGSKSEKKWVDEVLEISGLMNLSHNNITSLSGGQQQRVALARALVRKPDILLMDEPLSALDFGTRAFLQDEILKIHNKYELTTILISHDKDEITKMSDQVFHLEQGEIRNSGKPGEIFAESPSLSGTIQNIFPREDHIIIEVTCNSKDQDETNQGNFFFPGQEIIISEKKKNQKGNFNSKTTT
ncbi:sulfate/molybdate ABC transporter ATP-binding protein [soil metagenome]